MSQNEGNEKIIILTLGNSSVGKTSFIQRYTNNTFQISNLTTTGHDMQRKIMKINDKTYKVDFHDTQGQERYRAISKNFIKNADGIILMYDITNQTSFDSIAEWMDNIRKAKAEGFPIVLVGNKCDLEEMRVISKEEGEELAKKYELSFYETSNKDSINIEDSCLDLINKAIAEKEKELENGLRPNNTLKLDIRKTIINKEQKSNCKCKEK